MSAPGTYTMLEDPVLGRQWVLRRMQKALTTELAGAAFEAGIARASGDPIVLAAAEASAERATTLAGLIRAQGSVPYGSVGLARAAARMGGWLVGAAGGWAWRRAVAPLATHLVSEYDLLVTLVDGAPGVEPGLPHAVRPLLESARAHHRAIEANLV